MQIFSKNVYLYLPDNLHFSCTFRLFFFPLSIIPIKFIKENYKSWYKVQMFVHPACFQDAFWNVPLIRCPLKSQGEKKVKIYNIFP